MKKHLAVIFGLLLFSCCIIFTGCMVGPDYSRPQTAAQVHENFLYSEGHEVDVNDFSLVDRWWEGFGDQTTAELVRRALENNYDLQAAAARLIQAEALVEQARSALLPSITYGLSRDRSKRSFNLGGGFGGGRFSVMSTTWSHDISTSYVLDFFGKLRRAERAVIAEMFAAQANRQALVNSIIAAVVSARINISVMQRRLDIVRANIESQQQTLDIVQRRYDQGLVGPVDVRLATETLASLRALEPAIELSLITAHNALDVLLARRPGTTGDLPMSLNELPALPSLPIGVPADLIDRRPDIVAAEFSLRSANEQVGVSVAQLFPDLTLTGTYGFSGDTMEEIFQQDETEMYAAIISLAQPVFNAGRLRSQVDAAKARYEELTAVYAATVLNAIREVEDALVSERLLAEQLEQTKIRLAEAQAAEDLSRQRYQNGVEAILSVLESERRSRMAEEELIVLQGQIWTARVNLYLALGGDWDMDEETLAMENNDEN